MLLIVSFRNSVITVSQSMCVSFCDSLYVYVCLHLNFSFDQRLKVHPNGTLSIQAVTEKDAGDYLCIARNKVADDYRLLRVSVATRPAKIEPKQPLNQMVLFGKPLTVRNDMRNHISILSA